MKSLGIDTRALATASLTGVGVYELNLLEALIALDPALCLKFWTSGSKIDHQPHISSLLKRPQDQHSHFSWSNRYFNLASVAGWSGARLYRQVEADYYFFPHANFIPLPPPKPFVVTIHDLSFIHQPSWYDLKGQLWHQALRLNELLTAAHDIIAVSQSTAENIQRFFPNIPSSKIHMIHNGISSEELTTEELEQIKKRLLLPDSFLLYIGTLEPRKNVSSVIASFLQVQKEHPSLKLVLAGKYGWSSEQRRLMKKYAKVLLWLDYVSEREKLALYQLAQIFIWPSFHEGFGFPPLEAAAAGTPVITSYTTAMPELLEHHAWYVNPYNYQELAQVINQILRQPADRQRQPHLLQRYTWEETAKKTLAIIQAL